MKRTCNSIASGAGAFLALVLLCFCTGGCRDSRPSGHEARATNIVTLTEANFKAEVLSASKPVLVDFWASWCPPCRALAPIIDDIAREFDGRAVIGAVDVDAAPALAQQFGITGLPTVVLFQNGKVVEQALGLRSKAEYQRMLNNRLSSPAGTPSATNSVPR